jgi:predicted RNA-binding protein YlqC (UPF0109 family)
MRTGTFSLIEDGSTVDSSCLFRNTLPNFMEQDQIFIEYVVKAIVNNPNDVKTTRTVDERGVLITLDINASDMGYVIGRQGQTARALRTLLKIVGAKNNARVNLKINEPVGGRGPRVITPVAGVSPSLMDIDTSAVDDLTI